MFDIGWGELLVIGVVALIVIGPKELPGVLRSVGQWTSKIRRMAAEFQNQFQEALREAEMADLKNQVDELNDAARGLNSRFDPLDLGESGKWQPSSTSATPAAAPEAAASPSPPTAGAQADASEVPAAAAETEAAIAAAAAEVSIPPAEPAPGSTGKDAPPSAPSPGSGQ